MYHSEEKTELKLQLSLFERSAWQASSMATKKGLKDNWGQGRAPRNVFVSLGCLRELRNEALSPCVPSRWAGEEMQTECALEKWPETGRQEGEAAEEERKGKGKKTVTSQLSVGIRERR